MKVLITGENSYAGTQFSKRISDLNINWEIDYISVRTDAWREKDFSIYDAVYHVAAIVHQKEKAKNKGLYFKVNRDLTFQLALKAKNEGVKSFVFLSTMAVYGLIGKIGEDTIISKETVATPVSNYGKSKLEAEKLLMTLGSTEFKVSILRIPMIYGKDCPGNYSSLRKLAKKTPIFPKINNRRSMIFVDFLSEIVTYIIERRLSGLFLVKNPEDVNTMEMVNEIAKNHNRKVYNSLLLGVLVKKFGNKFTATRKMFSSIVYSNKDCGLIGERYNNTLFEESIARSENRNYHKSPLFYIK